MSNDWRPLSHSTFWCDGADGGIAPPTGEDPGRRQKYGPAGNEDLSRAITGHHPPSNPLAVHAAGDPSERLSNIFSALANYGISLFSLPVRMEIVGVPGL